MQTQVLQELGEPVVLAEQMAEQALRCTAPPGSALVVSTPHPERDGPNQDAAALLPVAPEALVLAVADGVGGGPAGARAARLAVEALSSAVPLEVATAEELRNAVLDGFERANEAVLAESGGGATTLAVASLEDGSARTYHVGDSRILVVGQRGRLKLQTISHSPVGYAVEAGIIDRDEALHHEDRHLVANVIGSTDMRIEVGTAVELAPRDTMLLASDGLFDNLYREEIVELIRKGPLAPAGQNLRRQAVRQMLEPDAGHPSKPDDLTFILFRRSV